MTSPIHDLFRPTDGLAYLDTATYGLPPRPTVDALSDALSGWQGGTADWIEDWDPLVVLSNSGIAEPDCVFVTEGSPSDSIWYITGHEPHEYVEMVKITPSVTACKLTIQLRPAEGGSEATVTYMHTSLHHAVLFK